MCEPTRGIALAFRTPKPRPPLPWRLELTLTKTSILGELVALGVGIDQPTQITLDPVPRTLVANGTDRSILTARVTDDQDNPLPDGTPVRISADKGTFENGEGLIFVPISGGNGEAIAV